MSKMNEERVNPIRITVDGNVYELDFSRESVAFAEQRGFKAEDVIAFPNTKVPELFFYALRKNHKFIARTQSDKLLDSIGGMTVAMMERLKTESSFSNSLTDPSFKVTFIILFPP